MIRILFLFMLILTMACAKPAEPTKEILVAEELGECWVIERDYKGEITESLFHSNDIEKCKEFAGGK
jgi:hypothetical protein